MSSFAVRERRPSFLTASKFVDIVPANAAEHHHATACSYSHAPAAPVRATDNDPLCPLGAACASIRPQGLGCGRPRDHGHTAQAQKQTLQADHYVPHRSQAKYRYNATRDVSNIAKREISTPTQTSKIVARSRAPQKHSAPETGALRERRQRRSGVHAQFWSVVCL